MGRPAPPTRPRSRRDDVAIAASLLLHVAAVALLLFRPGGRSLPPPEKPLEVEMVQQEEHVRGAPPPPAPAPAAESRPAPPRAASPPSPSLPQAKSAPEQAAAAPPLSPSAPPSRPQPPAKTTPPAVNLGNAAEDLDALSVTGDNIVPPAPDARYRNEPPRYPPKAARIGAEGTVQLVVKVAPNGRALGVEVLTSSGNGDLDQEARRAVELWHFRPARAGAAAVPYDYVLNIHFALGDR